jgi:hypothetical protein
MAAGRRVFLQASAALTVWIAVVSTAPSFGAPRLPDKLSDREFWALTQSLSEPGGTFRFDNFLSNERGYQLVIPNLVAKVPPGGVYLGVGPEQNFTYIAALDARLAFVIDIRRGNLLEHLLYKALFELAGDRAEFLSYLFSRSRPPGLSTTTAVADLFNAYDPVQPSETLYQRNLKAVLDRLAKKHGFPLSEEDVRGIQNVYHQAFFTGGPLLNYSMDGAGFSGGNSPSYWELMAADDGEGVNHSFLATEQSFAFIKRLETRNLIVPVVGDFGGPKAIRAVGAYLKARGGTVSVFYLSNVEQYLLRDGSWSTFCQNVTALPLTSTSTYIYSGNGGPMSARAAGSGSGAVDRFHRATNGLDTSIRPIEADPTRCNTLLGR